MHFKTVLCVILCVWFESAVYSLYRSNICNTSPRGIFQDNSVISYEQLKKKSKKLQTSVFSQGRHRLLLTMVWAGMCLFQLDESMCTCQESFTFPFFLSCCIQPWHCICLLYLFLGCAGSSFGIDCVSVFVSLPPCLTSFKWDQGGKKPIAWRV